jgi:hypothetical protein
LFAFAGRKRRAASAGSSTARIQQRRFASAAAADEGIVLKIELKIDGKYAVTDADGRYADRGQ